MKISLLTLGPGDCGIRRFFCKEDRIYTEETVPFQVLRWDDVRCVLWMADGTIITDIPSRQVRVVPNEEFEDVLSDFSFIRSEVAKGDRNRKAVRAKSRLRVFPDPRREVPDMGHPPRIVCWSNRMFLLYDTLYWMEGFVDYREIKDMCWMPTETQPDARDRLP